MAKKIILYLILPVLIIIGGIICLYFFVFLPKIKYQPKTTATPSPSASLSLIGELQEERVKQPDAAPVNYRLTESVLFTNGGENDAQEAYLFISLAQTILPFQKIKSIKLEPKNYEVITDKENNRYAKYTFKNFKGSAGKSNSQSEVKIIATYEFELYKFKDNLENCSGDKITSDLEDEEGLDIKNPTIISLSNTLTANAKNDCQKARFIYDYVQKRMTYEQYSQTGALLANELGKGSCSDYSDLYASISRGSQIPTRIYSGIIYRTDTTDPNLVKHYWNHTYLPGIGFTPVDATLGDTPGKENDYFAATPGESIIFSRGRDTKIINDYTFRGYAFIYYYDTNPVDKPAGLYHAEDWKMEKLTN